MTSFYDNTVQDKVGRSLLHSSSGHMMQAETGVHIQAGSYRSGLSSPAGAPWGEIQVEVRPGGMEVRVQWVEVLPCSSRGDNWEHKSEGKDLLQILLAGSEVE